MKQRPLNNKTKPNASFEKRNKNLSIQAHTPPRLVTDLFLTHHRKDLICVLLAKCFLFIRPLLHYSSTWILRYHPLNPEEQSVGSPFLTPYRTINRIELPPHENTVAVSFQQHRPFVNMIHGSHFNYKINQTKKSHRKISIFS